MKNTNNNSEEDKTKTKENRINPNLFQGTGEIENAKFPIWDIIPPNHFINPRIRPRS